MINHLVFEHFPYSSINETVWDEFVEFCGIYAVTRFVAVAYMHQKNTIEDFTDCIAGLFRCFEHSNANKVILAKLNEMDITNLPSLKPLLNL